MSKPQVHQVTAQPWRLAWRQLSAAAISAGILVGCGGGTAAPSPDGSGSSPDAAPQALREQAAAATPVTSDWVKIASEGQSYTAKEGDLLRYGSANRWVQTRATSNSVGQCSTGFFGSDPLPNVFKECQRSTVYPPPAPAPAAGPSPAWTTWKTVSSEGQNFSVPTGTKIRYGSGSRWVQLMATSETRVGQCISAFFGVDPAPGAAKECQKALPLVRLTSRFADAKPVASEGQTFTLDRAYRVYYGSQDRIEVPLSKIVPAGTFPCTNAFFGFDPAPNMGKECRVNPNPDDTAPRTTSPYWHWMFIASEGQSFANDASVGVRLTELELYFSARALPAHLVIGRQVPPDGSGACTTFFFGTDPDPGIVKSCLLVGFPDF